MTTFNKPKPESPPPDEVKKSAIECLLDFDSNLAEKIGAIAPGVAREILVETISTELFKDLSPPVQLGHLYVTCIHHARFRDFDDEINTRLLIHIYNYDSPPVVPISFDFSEAGLIGSNKHWYSPMDSDLPDRIDDYKLTLGGVAIGYLYFCVPADVQFESFVVRSEDPESATTYNYIWKFNRSRVSENQDSGVSIQES